jgi:hypothetical protein
MKGNTFSPVTANLLRGGGVFIDINHNIINIGF